MNKENVNPQQSTTQPPTMVPSVDNSDLWKMLILESYNHRYLHDYEIDQYCASDLWPNEEQVCSKILKACDKQFAIKKARTYLKNRLEELKKKKNQTTEVGLNQSMMDFEEEIRIPKCVIAGCGKLCIAHSTCCMEHSCEMGK